MVAVGIWIAIVGYGIAYSGYVQLGGGKCSILDAFAGKCQPTGATAASTPQSGQTLLAAAQAQHQQQAGFIGAQPIPQVA